ncbi:MAG: carboxymuconolactone decarboxylase family protein [Pyrinomonadaceae bacterium]
MSRITAINHENAQGKARDLLDAVQAKLGITPNLMKTLAHSPTVLEAYLNFNGTLGTTLNARLREQISVLTAEENRCGYCLSAHTFLGEKAGLHGDDLAGAREAKSADAKTDAGLKFAQVVLKKHGSVSDADIEAVRAAGYNDGEIAEIVANTALNVFTNYFNNVAETEIDFPKVELLTKSAVA